jgi:hypothetical protein
MDAFSRAFSRFASAPRLPIDLRLSFGGVFGDDGLVIDFRLGFGDVFGDDGLVRG